jgi:cell division protein FtsQ
MSVRARTPRAIARPRRGRRIRRASAGLSPARAGAALAMLIAAAAMYGVAASSVFAFREIRVDGVHYTDPQEVTARLALGADTNLFRLSTDAVAARLRELTSVAAADVVVQLPNTVAVTIRERVPILVWVVGDRQLLVDRDGLLFADAARVHVETFATLPAMSDQRAASSALAVGSRLDPIDLDAATRLGSIRPSDVGSVAARLSIDVTDENGFVLRTPNAWQAVFGFYTPSLRTPALIPGQLRLLRSLLTGREAQVERVILASDTSGTFVPRATLKPAKSARP